MKGELGLAAIIFATGCSGNKHIENYSPCEEGEPQVACQPYWKVNSERPPFIEYSNTIKSPQNTNTSLTSNINEGR